MVVSIIFSRESNSTITNVCSSVSLSAKPLNSLKSLSYITNHSSFFIHPTSFFIHPSFILHSSIIHPSFILHSSFIHFATFKLFSLFMNITYSTQCCCGIIESTELFYHDHGTLGTLATWDFLPPSTFYSPPPTYYQHHLLGSQMTSEWY